MGTEFKGTIGRRDIYELSSKVHMFSWAILCVFLGKFGKKPIANAAGGRLVPRNSTPIPIAVRAIRLICLTFYIISYCSIKAQCRVSLRTMPVNLEQPSVLQNITESDPNALDNDSKVVHDDK
jgi:hypothetical protein